MENLHDIDDRIRIAAFEWLDKQSSIHGDVLSRDLLVSGFQFNDQRINLLGAKGIWKPKSMTYPLSITTISTGPYSDHYTDDGFLKYKYRGQDPAHPDNKGLRALILLQKPLIYFHSIIKGKYLVTWPVYIINDNKKDLVFTVAVDDIKMVNRELYQSNEDATFYRRSYLTSNIQLRLHQRSFRERVLLAYSNQCALCKLKHIELLDAAHIISDKEDSGDPIVQNGLALCKIHHAAFDNHFIGINPDFIVKIRTDLLNENDGPMLKYGIQSLNNSRLLLPSDKRNWPDKERLEQRFSAFLKAG
jgi:putative restriction endonuclease